MPTWLKAALPAVAVTLIAIAAINRLGYLAKVKAAINGPGA